MRRTITLLALLFVSAGVLLWLQLFRPFLVLPKPADLICLDPQAGQLQRLGPPRQIYGLGLSFAGHIEESPGLYEPDQPPPVFRKDARTWNRSDELVFPQRKALLEAAGRVDRAHAEALSAELAEVPPLLDYEVEIGLVVLEDFPVSDLEDPSFAPRLGFFVANDVTARILLGMAPKFTDTVGYLAEGKSLVGFLPVGETMWVPEQPERLGWPCVELVTRVNDVERQRASSTDIILAPPGILQAVAAGLGITEFKRGDWIITGTPPGVALQTPGWMQRAMKLFDPPAGIKVGALAGRADEGGFLRPGDEVVVSAGYLGAKRSRVVGQRP